MKKFLIIAFLFSAISLLVACSAADEELIEDLSNSVNTESGSSDNYYDNNSEQENS